MTRILLASLALLALAACGGGDTGGKSTTRLDAVEVQPGSISDSMIILDDAASDGTAVDNSVPDDGTKKETAKADDTDAADTPGEDGAGTDNPEAVDMPVAKKAITADPAAKKGE
ncbi:MAG: hypothetical protein JHC57_16875 [Sphingopyxis sp.]|uniref:hypothetical protein n=1 Tax=Sphingopyxis sp. TaxID=1908224 RepID=UPI001A2B6D2E|nr:hypothetical protein [Sphingopyxis sp.]MBJ7501433.1 hypothetical protein [Sphingopyxis sp.]